MKYTAQKKTPLKRPANRGKNFDPPKLKPATKAKRDPGTARISAVENLILSGYISLDDVCSQMQKTRHKFDRVKISQDINRVMARLHRPQDPARVKEALDVQEAAQWVLFRANVKAKRYDDARKNLESIRRLRGYDKPVKTPIELDLTADGKSVSESVLEKIARSFLEKSDPKNQ